MAKNKQHQRKGKSNLKNLLASTQKAQAAADAQARREKAKQAQAVAVKKSATGGGGGSAASKGKKRRNEAGNDDALAGEIQVKRVRRPKVVRPAERDDTVLLVGEGNFSFAHAMLLPPHNHPAHLLIATAYDSEDECYAKYPDAAEHVSAIRRQAGSDDAVLFGVDAGALDVCKPLSSALSRRQAGPSFSSSLSSSLDAAAAASSSSSKKSRHHGLFTKVIFNFPHVGQGHKDEARNVAANQLMLGRFLCAAAPLLSVGATPDFGKRKQKSAGAQDDEEEEEEELDEEDEEEGDLLGEADQNEAEALEAIGEAPGDKAAQSVKPWRTPPSRAGSILITQRNCKPYVLWDVPRLAKQLSTLLPRIAKAAPALPKGQSLPPALLASTPQAAAAAAEGVPRYRLWRSWEFDPSSFSGYEHRRTLGFVPGLSSEANEDILRGTAKGKDVGAAKAEAGLEVRKSRAGGGECRTWQFGVVPPSER